jgi:glycosyltransferase involved in cell wall biosynthesis
VGWYPAADDQIIGRFVADQATALRDTGRVRPSVVSFEPFWLHGDWSIRSRTAAAWPLMIGSAARAGLLFSPHGANGPTGIPVARLGTPAGRTILTGSDNEAVHRATALKSALAASASNPWRLIHAHVGYPDGAAAGKVAARLGIPFIITEHATYLARLWTDPAVRRRYLEGARAASRFIAVGSGLAEQIEAQFPELRGRVTVIPNTVDVKAFKVGELNDRDPNELLWVGYRREIKGMPTLLRAFQIVRRRRPATTLTLIGRSASDQEEAGWHALAAELGVLDAVRFEGPADRTGVAAAMARAACFVHPSSRETMGIVAVEALAAGLPVVATDSGGVTEVLGATPSSLGALVPKEDPEALAAAILATLERRGTFDPHRLRSWVEEQYGGHGVARRLADLYDEVLAEANQGSGKQRQPALSADARPTNWYPLAAKIIVVAFDRPALDRAVAQFGAEANRNVVVVTTGEPSPLYPRSEMIAPENERLVASLLAGGRKEDKGRSFQDVVEWPIRWLRQFRSRRRLEALVIPQLSAALDRALDQVGATPSDPALLVCLGGIDVFVSRAFVGTGRAIVAPGGLRWLGDARSSRNSGGVLPDEGTGHASE